VPTGTISMGWIKKCAGKEGERRMRVNTIGGESHV